MTGNYKFAPAVVIFFARGSSVLIWFRGYGNYFLRIAPIPPLNGINMALAPFLFNCCELKWGEVRWGGEWSAAPHMWAYLFWFDPLGPERWWFSNGLEYLQSFSFLNKRFNWLFMSFFIVFYCKKTLTRGGGTPEIGRFLLELNLHSTPEQREQRNYLKRCFEWGGLCCKIQIPQSQLKAWIFYDRCDREVRGSFRGSVC